jgi:hypothetical protein
MRVRFSEHAKLFAGIIFRGNCNKILQRRILKLEAYRVKLIQENMFLKGHSCPSFQNGEDESGSSALASPKTWARRLLQSAHQEK